jgi:sugar O-acyltransferase (sialic acid O-acetyltransferase NeuD family)
VASIACLQQALAKPSQAGARKLLLLGAGRHALEMLQTLAAMPEFSIIACAEQNCQRVGTLLRGVPIIDSAVLTQGLAALPGLAQNIELICAFGASARADLVHTLTQAAPYRFANVIAPSAHCERSELTLGQGVYVGPNSTLTVNTQIGDHSIINIACSISHDCVLGRYVTLSPGVRLAGHVAIEDGVFLGIGAVVIDRVRLGAHSFIAAGSVVTKDVAAHSRVAGVPARVMC